MARLCGMMHVPIQFALWGISWDYNMDCGMSLIQLESSCAQTSRNGWVHADFPRKDISDVNWGGPGGILSWMNLGQFMIVGQSHKLSYTTQFSAYHLSSPMVFRDLDTFVTGTFVIKYIFFTDVHLVGYWHYLNTILKITKVKLHEPKAN